MKAIVIDDAYTRPTPAQLREYLNALRAFLSDHLEVKTWMDAEFGLHGNHMRGDYFDPLLASNGAVRRFWEMRDQSPRGAALSAAVFAGFEREIEDERSPLMMVESRLAAAGWQFDRFGRLPARAEDLDATASMLVVDYVMDRADPDASVERSKGFIAAFLKHAAQQSDFKCPFVMLISALPGQAEQHAEEFREALRLHSAFFRFCAKNPQAAVVENFDETLDTFLRQRTELESYRKLHVRLRSVAGTAASNVLRSIDSLELQDLATLHAGQLVQEGELLSDYLAWLYGQVFTADMIQDLPLASEAWDLPVSSYAVLLGHLRAPQQVPALFAAFSSTMPAVTKKNKAEKQSLQLRFGDLFVRKETDARPELPPAPAAPAAVQEANAQVPAPVAAGDAGQAAALAAPLAAAPEAAPAAVAPTANAGAQAAAVAPAHPAVATAPRPGYLMVISQTCDLIHSNITNGQALCLEGTAVPIASTEAGRLRATIRQMANQGRILVKDGEGFVQIEWGDFKNLRTLDVRDLSVEKDYRYLGRLNELYALEAQHSALEVLGRIGVPIHPGFSVFFKRVNVKVFKGKTHVAALDRALDNQMVIAVLRNEKIGSPKRRLVISHELRTWLLTTFRELIGAEGVLPNALKTPLQERVVEIEADPQWSLVVKEDAKGAKFSVEKTDAVSGQRKGEALTGFFSVVLKEVFDTPVNKDVHVRIELEQI